MTKNRQEGTSNSPEDHINPTDHLEITENVSNTPPQLKTRKIQYSKQEPINSHQSHNTTNLLSTNNKTFRRTQSKFVRFITALNYPNILITLLIPLYASYQIITNQAPLHKSTLYFSLLYYFLTISAFHIGYHRYYAHRSFVITTGLTRFLEFTFLLLGASCGLGSAQNWVCTHRAHHRYVDTEKDPSYIRKGVFFAHWGNLLLRQRVKVRNSVKECQSEEMIKSKMIRGQDINYYGLLVVFGFVFPSVVCGFLLGNADFIGGFIYAGVLRMFVIQQSVMCVNSIGHLLGTQPYDDRKSHVDNCLLSLITFGEGCNNFHHEFSSDYRNGFEWYQFDPIKYELLFLRLIGVISSLSITHSESITQVKLQQQQKLIDMRRSKLNWGVPIDQLPLITPAEFRELARESYPERALIAVAGIVHDVSPFVEDHPGGVLLIKSSIGKDATSAFNGAVYDHSTAAHNLLATMRIAVIKGEGEVKVWQKQTEENVDVPLMKDSRGNRIVRSGGQDTIVKGVVRTAGAA
ncbi:hypothetical protein WICPIJ_004066 [Wickerhamomyces pijperi]|uniref:Acyl-CoA desaturase n=1 Tax=Wickerhamomyces pijperi TaxID=599730 RepID=A0A9P8Q8M3_WICPI|nr:hypothetical protein WICPIJ_004066 [Wickerhamomyces pijperi]